jgi:hypothetical protein
MTGIAQTMVSCSMARFEDVLHHSVKEVLYPDWINDLYKPDQIDTVYKDLCPMKNDQAYSIMHYDKRPGSSVNYETQEEAANAISEDYFALATEEDRLAFAKRFIRRNIANRKEVFAIMLDKNTEEVFEGLSPDEIIPFDELYAQVPSGEEGDLRYFEEHRETAETIYRTYKAALK